MKVTAGAAGMAGDSVITGSTWSIDGCSAGMDTSDGVRQECLKCRMAQREADRADLF